MSKPKRNDPCPCGSGKKYKKCCGASNVAELSPVLYDRELENLHEMLIEFSFVNYEETVKNIYMEQPSPESFSTEVQMETYMGGLIPWIILHEIPAHSNQTIFEAFLKNQQSKIKRTRTLKLFQEWPNSTPGVYEILPITNDTTITLRDVITEKTYEVQLQDDYEFEEGNILIATLIPYTTYHQFLFETIEIDSMMKGQLIELAEEYIAVDGNLIENYPDFLAEALTLLPPADELEWINPIHEMVATHFSNKMRKIPMEEDIIQTGIYIWYLYCQLENPSIKKLGSYAAAVEYIVRKKLGGENYITQNQLAKSYDTSSASISKIVREIETVIDEQMDEFMEEMDGELDFDEEVDSFIDQRPNMDNMLQDIQKIMEDQDFKSPEEMNAFLDNLLSSGEIPSPSSDDPHIKAQEKLEEARQIPGPQNAKKRVKRIKEALEIYPNNPDAFLLLANDAKSQQEYHHLIHQAVVVGKKDLGEEFFKENKGYFWGLIETRPFMRAKAVYGSILYEMGMEEEAINEFEEMLELNPNDNQGIRDSLLLIYIKEEQFKKAQELMRKYEEDESATFGFNRALVHYLTKGMTNKTKALLKAAHNENPYVKDYLLGKKQIPGSLPQYIGIGDDNEAIFYVQDHFYLWMGEEELLKELAKL